MHDVARRKAKDLGCAGHTQRIGGVVPSGRRQPDLDCAGVIGEAIDRERRAGRARLDDGRADGCVRRLLRVMQRRPDHGQVSELRSREDRGDPWIRNVRDEHPTAWHATSQATNASRTAAASAKTSGWSHSMLVSTASPGRYGVEVAGVLVGLHDEASPRPVRAVADVPPVSAAGSNAPTNAEGSRPASTRTWTSQPAVVLLPCVPATATSRRPTAASAMTCCHGSTGIPSVARGAELRMVGVDRGQRLRHGEPVGVWARP